MSLKEFVTLVQGNKHVSVSQKLLGILKCKIKSSFISNKKDQASFLETKFTDSYIDEKVALFFRRFRQKLNIVRQKVKFF